MRLIVLVALLAWSAAVWASCRTESVVIGGKTYICVTCCDRLGNCTTSCQTAG